MLKKNLSGFFAIVALIIHQFLIQVPAGFASEINLPRSGQTNSYGSGDEGAIQAGLPSPSPRFDAANGKVTDNLTGLVWLQNANCTETVGGVIKTGGILTWSNALAWSNSLASGKCGLTDSSIAGHWRLPTRKELQTLADESKTNPALPSGHPFSNVLNNNYWSSSTYAGSTTFAWHVSLIDGLVDSDYKTNSLYVWPVSAGQ